MRRARQPPASLRRSQRGQALILTVLLMLFVTVTVFLTFAIGARTRRKIQIQSVADATAYSLAVAEARAFNFYAWSNRALVAHNVSLLSVHAHTSYLTFYEDLLAATANNYRIMAQRTGDPAATVLNKIADIYQNSDIYIDTDGRDRVCEWIPDPGSPTGRKCSVDAACSGSTDCDLDISNKVRGAEFFHSQWHAKANSNSCYQLVSASRNHFMKLELLRAHQLGVDAQMKLMMSGNAADMIRADDPRLEASTQERMFRDLKSQINALPEQSLAQQIATLSDPRLTAHNTAGVITRDYYLRAVDDGLENNYHKDFDEILSGTRFPDFITQRGFQEDINWVRLANKARRVAAPLGIVPVTQVFSEGTSRVITLRSVAEDPGQYSDRPGPLVDTFPPIYRNMPIPPVGAPPAPRYQLPRGGTELADRVHEARRATRFGDGDGIGSEDHGWVESRFDTLRERTQIDAGRNTVWGDPHDWRGSDSHVPLPGDNTTHSNHVFHADLMRVPGHGSQLGKCNNALCNSAQRGVYRGHMRFKLTEDANNLWNMPRTLSFISTPVPDRMPWDFDFRVSLPRPITFTTTASIADSAADRRMGVFAGGLVYFHKPPNSGEEYAEPPNFWNPFWRAKLHPVKQSDARDASTPHAPTRRALLELDGYRAVNY